MLECIVLIISGILAVPSLILSKKPDAKELLDKVTPYQGYFGVVILVWGLWSIIHILLNMGAYFNTGFLGILLVAVAIVTTVLGFILGYNLINTYVLSKNAKSEEKGQQLLAKLLPLQGKFGIAAIILGIVFLVIILVHR